MLEPAAGRGHLSLELRRAGLDVVSFDLHRYSQPLVHDVGTGDIRGLTTLEGFAWVVTYLPYSDLEELATHLIGLGIRDRCGVALLVRSEWIVPKARRRLVHEHPHFAGTVILTARPRWVERVQDSELPRHNFAWGVWGAAPASATLGCGLLEDNSRRYCPYEILPPALGWRYRPGRCTAIGRVSWLGATPVQNHTATRLRQLGASIAATPWRSIAQGRQHRIDPSDVLCFAARKYPLTRQPICASISLTWTKFATSA